MIGSVGNSLQMSPSYLQGLNSSGQGSAVLQSESAKAISTSHINSSKTLDTSSAQRIPFSDSLRNDNSGSQGSPNEPDDSQNSFQVSRETAQQEQQVQQVISQLKARDTEVRAHEMAHLSAAGSYARGGMSFTYQTGPDGKKYAIGGEVGIDTSPVSGDPEATLQKAMVIQRAALAPAEPSAQDQKVAQAANQMMAQARADIASQAMEEQRAVQEEGDSEDLSDMGSQMVEGESRSITINPDNAQEDLLQSANNDRQQFNLRLQIPPAESMYSS